jgi:two-component system, OmpR family, sensor histidine kinase VicK
VLKEIKPLIADKKLKVIKKFGQAIPKVNLDDKLMRIVWQNLLSNALKYTPAKGQITISIAKDKTKVKIAVADTGMGIPKAQQKNIFTKLFRADNVREKETSGTGLGLYIVKSVIEQFGGKVWFKSIEKKGTTFYVTIPLKGIKAKTGTRGLEYTK